MGAPGGVEDAYLQVAACAEFLSGKSPASAVPYLLCTALRLGETRSADLANYSFAVAPPTEVRQAMRRLANEQKWAELMKLCIQDAAGAVRTGVVGPAAVYVEGGPRGGK